MERKLGLSRIGRGPFSQFWRLFRCWVLFAQSTLIKLYSSLNPKFVPGIVKTAHARGLRMSGHIPNGMIASQFVEAGADEIQHINFIFLNFIDDKVIDTRTPERFTAVGAYAAKLDLQSRQVNDFIALLLQHHTTVDVTLATFEGMFAGRSRRFYA